MEKVRVVKIGGNIIDNEDRLRSFVELLAVIPGKKVLIHGGGKLATSLAQQMGIPQQMVEGRRITDAATIKIVTMVYAGYINKNIVAILQAHGNNALGITGADLNCISAHKRPLKNGIDYGYVGDITDTQDKKVWQDLLEMGWLPVVAPLSHDGKGQLLNVNADTVAQETARMLSRYYDVDLFYLFEKPGVLRDVADDNSVIDRITLASFKVLKEDNIIADGMLPKLENAFEAIQSGVKSVRIGIAEALPDLIEGTAGTQIVYG